MPAIYVALGGAAGSVTRYYAGIWITNATGARTPGTVAINVLGSFVIGLFLVLSSQRSWPNALVFLVAIGFLGGFTTFSAFTWQTYSLLKTGETARAVMNVGASIALGMMAVWAGASIGEMID
jgi:CrcB protein